MMNDIFEIGADEWEAFKRDMENNPYGEELPSDMEALEQAFYMSHVYG